MRGGVLVVVVSMGLAGGTAAGPGELVDLTHAFDATTLYWPTEAEGFVLERGFAGETDAGYYYEAHRFRSAEHGGTHLDAPVHFSRSGAHVDEIPLEHLIGPARVVDVSEASANNPDHQVTTQELRDFETRHGRIPDGAILLLRTGFSEHWPDRETYLGTAEIGPDAVPKLHFPGLHPDAARWLVSERRVTAVGIDTASIDPGQSRLFETHRILFAHGVPAFENVANLSALPAAGARVVALPMKIRGGSGAPLRIIAILPGSD